MVRSLNNWGLLTLLHPDKISGSLLSTPAIWIQLSWHLQLAVTKASSLSQDSITASFDLPVLTSTIVTSLSHLTITCWPANMWHHSWRLTVRVIRSKQLKWCSCFVITGGKLKWKYSLYSQLTPPAPSRQASAAKTVSCRAHSISGIIDTPLIWSTRQLDQTKSLWVSSFNTKVGLCHINPLRTPSYK